MKYIVYLTTNTENSKIYVGIHKVENPDTFDGYIGCGVNINRPSTYKKSKTPFQYAVNKYGVKSFIRNTLFILDTLEEALLIEEQIVDKDFISRKDTYNIAPGGGFFPMTNKKLFQYDLLGNFVKEWESHIEASRYYEVNESSINHAVAYKTTSVNHLWSNEKYEILDIKGFNCHSIQQTIFMYDIDGNLSNTFISVTEAANVANTTTSNILRAIKGKYKINDNYYSLELFGKFLLPEKISIKNKKLYAYELSGEFYKEFASFSQVSSELKIKSSGVINTSIRTGRACANYQWSLEKVDSMKKLIPDKPKKRKVGVYENDVMIDSLDSILATKNKYGSGIQKVLEGKSLKHKGLIFKYID